MSNCRWNRAVRQAGSWLGRSLAGLGLVTICGACGTKLDPVNYVPEPDTVAPTDTPCYVDVDTYIPDIPIGNPGHTEDHGGVLHKPGGADPLANCVTCHGAQLKGGIGPSCYSCHNNDDHPYNREGVMHQRGTNSSCNRCHGPGNTGGLGPTCSKCHGTNNPTDD